MRADEYLSREGYFKSRTKAKEAILSGIVSIDGKIPKPSDELREGAEIVISGEQAVSNGGAKLKFALENFGVSVSGKLCLDAGASTGGFTEVLLLGGAAGVYALDVGENQLDSDLRSDKRVIVVDNTNVRDIEGLDLPKFDIVTADLSFISCRLTLPHLCGALKTGGEMIYLIKPQFECGKKALSKSGILRDDKLRLSIVDELMEFGRQLGLEAAGAQQVPRRNPNMNIEYAAHFIKR